MPIFTKRERERKIKMNLNALKENLIKKGYTVSLFETKEEATEYLKSTVSGKSVGIGGCITAKEMKLSEALSEKNEIIWHWETEKRSASEGLFLAQHTDIYFSSVNGISEAGEIVNIDGTCNRLASTLYGHKKVYLLIGKNKVAKTLDDAIYRARNVAAPLNAKRLGKNTPCAKNTAENKCYNCSSPERICKALTVFWEMPKGQEYEVILINEELGY